MDIRMDKRKWGGSKGGRVNATVKSERMEFEVKAGMKGMEGMKGMKGKKGKKVLGEAVAAVAGSGRQWQAVVGSGSIVWLLQGGHMPDALELSESIAGF